MSHQQLQPWHVFSGIFLAFWIMMSYFDNFFVTLVLCVGGGFATDNLNKYMKGPQGEFDDDQDQELQEPPTDCDFVCPDKPLPPEPPMSSNDVSEDELENANEVDERAIPERPAMTSSSNNSSSFKTEYEHQKEAILEEEKREELDFKELLVQNYDLKDLESSLLDFRSESNGNLIQQQQVNLLASGATFKQQSQEPELVPSQVSEEVQEVLPYGVNDINDKGIDLMKSEPLEPVEVLDASSEFFRESPEVPEVTESPQDIIIPENLQNVSEVPDIPVVPESSEEPTKMHAKTPSPDLMETIEEPPAPLDLIEQLEAKKYDHSVIMETVEPIMKSQNNPTPPPSPSEVKTSPTASEAKTQDLLVDFLSTHQPPPTEDKEASKSSSTEFETVPKEIQSDSLETSLITEAAGVGIDSSLVEHVAATSLEQHEEELANLLKEAQRDDDSPVKELEDIITQKDEGDPWVLDESLGTDMLQQEGQQLKEEFPFPEHQRLGSSSSSEAVRGSAGEALVHLGDSNDDMANKDDISHCAVFGDENEPDDLELDEDEKQPHRGSTGTGSSEDSSSSEGPDEEKPVMLEPTKSTTADTTVAPSSGHDVDDDDDLSSSSEEADNLHRPQTPPNSANSTSHDLAFDMGRNKYDDACKNGGSGSFLLICTTCTQ